MYNNYLLLRIKFFIFSPFFSSILTILICIICWSLNSVMLCDGETLYDLKLAIWKDTLEYNKIMEDYKHYDDLRWEAVNDPLRITNKIEYLNKKASDNIKCAMDILAKIRLAEDKIQKVETTFTSNIEKQWFEIKLFKKEPFKWTP